MRFDHSRYVKACFEGKNVRNVRLIMRAKIMIRVVMFDLCQAFPRFPLISISAFLASICTISAYVNTDRCEQRLTSS